jgi:hypothetical protein
MVLLCPSREAKSITPLHVRGLSSVRLFRFPRNFQGEAMTEDEKDKIINHIATVRIVLENLLIDLDALDR